MKYKVKVFQQQIKVPCAVLTDSEGFIHSVMASNCSMWSAGQRAFHQKKKGKRLVYEKTELTISGDLLSRMAEFYAKQMLVRQSKQKKTGSIFGDL